MTRRLVPVQERITRSIVVDDQGCWIWQKSIAQNGYGQIGVAGKIRSTHRVAYETFVGPIPDKAQLDHLCRVRACCNPMHLEPVTQSENLNRSPLVVKELCVNGHPLTPENVATRLRRNGNVQRNCKQCRLAAERKKYRRRLAASGIERQRKSRYDGAAA